MGNTPLDSTVISKGIVKAVLILFGISLLGYFLFSIRQIIAYIVVASIIALLGNPLMRRLKKIKYIPNALAAVLSLGILSFLFFGLLSLFIPVFITQGKNLSLLDISQLESDLSRLYVQLLDYTQSHIPQLYQYLQESNFEKWFLETFDLNVIPDVLSSIFQFLGAFSIGTFSVLFLAFFFLKEQNLAQNGILRFVPDQKEGQIIASLTKIRKMLTRYFSGIVLQITILFCIYTLALVKGGIENALLIAFLCSLFNIIPYLGPIIGAIIMAILTLTNYIGPEFNAVISQKLTYVMSGVVIGQLVDNFISQPFIFSKSVKAHPVEIFLVILISGLLLGIVGMIVAVPAYTSIRIILSYLYADHPLIQKITQ